MQTLKNQNKPFALSIFTQNSFKSLHAKLGVNSFLPSVKDINNIFSQFDSTSKIKNYTLDFSSTKELLRYIKKTGVSAGGFNLSPAILRGLIAENRIKKLEMEVYFV